MSSPRSILIVTVACLCLFLAVAVLSQIYPGLDASDSHLTKQDPLVTLIFVGFAGLSALIILNWFRERHYFDDRTLAYQTLTRSGAIAWRDISRISYAPSRKSFHLEASDGRVVGISVMLSGLEDFCRAVLAGVPTERIDATARDLLDSCARGELPSARR
jgi:hypothetical protein